MILQTRQTGVELLPALGIGIAAFPGDSPAFLRVGGLHGHLVAGKLENARQVFTDQAPHQGALHVKGEGVRVLVLAPRALARSWRGRRDAFA